jgi:hypothetical protein
VSHIWDNSLKAVKRINIYISSDKFVLNRSIPMEVWLIIHSHCHDDGIISSFNSIAHKNNYPNMRYRVHYWKFQECSYLGLDPVDTILLHPIWLMEEDDLFWSSTSSDSVGSSMMRCMIILPWLLKGWYAGLTAFMLWRQYWCHFWGSFFTGAFSPQKSDLEPPL